MIAAPRRVGRASRVFAHIGRLRPVPAPKVLWAGLAQRSFCAGNVSPLTRASPPGGTAARRLSANAGAGQLGPAAGAQGVEGEEGGVSPLVPPRRQAYPFRGRRLPRTPLTFSLRKQPQDRVLPLLRFPLATSQTLPHSHWHFHTTFEPERLSVGSKATRRPKRWLVRSLTALPTFFRFLPIFLPLPSLAEQLLVVPHPR